MEGDARNGDRDDHQYFAINMKIIDEVLVNRIPELRRVAEAIASDLPGGAFYAVDGAEDHPKRSDWSRGPEYRLRPI